MDLKAYKSLKDNFDREVSRIQRYKCEDRELTKKLEKRIEYKLNLVQTYNLIIKFFEPHIPKANLEEKLDINTKINGHLKKLKEAFVTLKLAYAFSKNIHDSIDLNSITENWTDLESSENTEKSSDNSSESTGSKQVDSSDANTIYNLSGISDNFDTNPTDNLTEFSEKTEVEQETEMAKEQDPEAFISLGHRTIPSKYDGDPMGLDSFLDAVSLLQSLCKEQNTAILTKFLLTRLEGEAREAIETTPKDADDIVEQLKARIRSEPSKVVEGRLLALRADASR